MNNRCEQEVTNLVWSFAKIGGPLSEEASALMDMVPAEVLLQLSDESRRCKARSTPPSIPGGMSDFGVEPALLDPSEAI